MRPRFPSRHGHRAAAALPRLAVSLHQASGLLSEQAHLAAQCSASLLGSRAAWLQPWACFLLTCTAVPACLACRAVAAPAVLVMAVAQGACLGQQDAWTPFKVLAAAGLLNAGTPLSTAATAPAALLVCPACGWWIAVRARDPPALACGGVPIMVCACCWACDQTSVVWLLPAVPPALQWATSILSPSGAWELRAPRPPQQQHRSALPPLGCLSLCLVACCLLLPSHWCGLPACCCLRLVPGVHCCNRSDHDCGSCAAPRPPCRRAVPGSRFLSVLSQAEGQPPRRRAPALDGE